MKEKVLVITDPHGKLLGAHRNVPVKHGNATLTFHPVTNDRQMSHEVEVDEDFFKHPLAHCRDELTRMVAKKK